MARAAALALVMAASAAMAIPPTVGAAPQPRHSEAFGSYLSIPEQENILFHDGLDSDELIGSRIIAPNGALLAIVTDLAVGDDGRVHRAVIDPGPALGAGARHVVVPIQRLRRTESGNGVLLLNVTDAELRALPTYRQVDKRWEPIAGAQEGRAAPYSATLAKHGTSPPPSMSSPSGETNGSDAAAEVQSLGGSDG